MIVISNVEQILHIILRFPLLTLTMPAGLVATIPTISVFCINRSKIRESIEIKGNLCKMQKQPPEVFCEKDVLKISQISQKNTCARVFNGVADLKACNFIKKRRQQRCFLVKLAKFL